MALLAQADLLISIAVAGLAGIVLWGTDPGRVGPLPASVVTGIVAGGLALAGELGSVNAALAGILAASSRRLTDKGLSRLPDQPTSRDRHLVLSTPVKRMLPGFVLGTALAGTAGYPMLRAAQFTPEKAAVLVAISLVVAAIIFWRTASETRGSNSGP